MNVLRLVRISLRIFICSAVVWSASASAPVFFPETRHFYQLILHPEGITWHEAKVEAASLRFVGLRGHLVTINSAAENQFVYDTFVSVSDANWLGAFQPAGSQEPAGGWRWVTGEPFDYTNWNPRGEPNNDGPTLNEDVLHMPASDGGFWNDVDGSAATSGMSWSLKDRPAMMMTTVGTTAVTTMTTTMTTTATMMMMVMTTATIDAA